MRKGHEDWDFYIRLLDGDGLVYQIPLPLFHYRIKKYSLTTLATQKTFLLKQIFIFILKTGLYILLILEEVYWIISVN